jgi:hypothetical protein
MLRWFQKWLPLLHMHSVEALSTDENDVPVLRSWSTHEFFVEFEGERIALLSEAHWRDMGRYDFKITCLTEDPRLVEKMRDNEFWMGSIENGLVLRNRASSEVMDDKLFGDFEGEDRIRVRWFGH